MSKKLDYISKYIPKYFLNQEKKNMYVPSLLFGKAEEDNGVEFDFSVLDKPFVNYGASSSDLEVQYAKHLRNDPLAIEVFGFICFFSSVQKIQLNYYFYSFSEQLRDLSEEKQKKRLKQALNKLYTLRFIRRTFIPEHSVKERTITSYSLTVNGAILAQHMRKRLGIQGKIYDPDEIYRGQNLQRASRMIKRNWAVLDVFLAASTLESFIGFRNHLNHIGSNDDNPMAIKESQCVLTLRLITGISCNLICYVALPDDKDYYNRVKVEQFKLLNQRYPDAIFPDFGESLNFLCFIVYSEQQAENLIQQFDLEPKKSPPILFIVLEAFQNSSVKNAFYAYDNGQISSFAENIASK